MKIPKNQKGTKCAVRALSELDTKRLHSRQRINSDARTPPSLGNKCSMQQVRHKRHRSSLYVGHSIRSSRLVGRTSDSPFSLPPSSNLQCVLYIRHGTMDPCRRWDAAARARAIHFVSSFAPQFYNYNAGSNLCTSELQREF